MYIFPLTVNTSSYIRKDAPDSIVILLQKPSLLATQQSWEVPVGMVTFVPASGIAPSDQFPALFHWLLTAPVQMPGTDS